MENTTLFSRFGVAILIGVLIGMQREVARKTTTSSKRLATGVRTFSFISLVGCTGALAAEMLNSPWPFVALIVVVGIFLAINYFFDASEGRIGMTTEVAALLVFMAGALVFWKQVTLAIALAVGTAVLLTIKMEMSRFINKMTQEDVYAILKFAVITAIVLPVLPKYGFGPEPFNVLVPFKIWMLVVFISGINFMGFFLIKLVGATKGIGLTGLLGGLASSTAVTLSFTQRSRESAELGKEFALAIYVAWTMLYLRVLIAVTVLNIELAVLLWKGMAINLLVGTIYVLYLLKWQRRQEDAEELHFSNPFELGPAIKFGILFTLVLLVSKAAQLYIGDAGVYLSGFLSGMADVNAIVLSVADLSKGIGGLDLQIAGRTVLLATVANNFVKGLIVVISGAPSLRRAIVPGLVLLLLAGILLTIFGV